MVNHSASCLLHELGDAAHKGLFACPWPRGHPGSGRTASTAAKSHLSYRRLYRRPTAFLDHLQWLSPDRLREIMREVGFSTATVGPISAVPVGSEPLPAAVDRLPFHSRRGALAGRIANRLAGAYHAFGISADHYTQLEIWATA